MVFASPIPITSIVAIIAALTGLWVSVHIYREKRKKTKLVCPLRANCDKVVHSTHATTFGIPNELLGVAYYLTIGAFYALSTAWPSIFSSIAIHYVMLLMTMIGVLFSIYFVALQAIVIKAWCSLCLVSAMTSTVLALCLGGIIDQALFEMIGSHKTWWVIAHSAGFILGVGAATITDIFFFRFLKDHQISEEEKGTLDTLTSVIWVGLALLVISGLMLFLPEQARLGASPKFLLKVVVVGVIIVNGLALNMFVAPRMRQLSFDGTKPARHFRRLAFALGGISIVSWYIAFILGSLRHIRPYSFPQGLIGYGVIILCVVIGSQLFERIVVKKYHALPETPLP